MITETIKAMVNNKSEIYASIRCDCCNSNKKIINKTLGEIPMFEKAGPQEKIFFEMFLKNCKKILKK